MFRCEAPSEAQGAAAAPRPVSISVVMPLYNKAPYVIEAVTSVLAQEHAALELIVVDDGSTDGGADRVRALCSSVVRVVTQANSGVSAARNAGIALANGELVAFLDADDVYLPGFLGALAALRRIYPEAGMLCTGYHHLNPETGEREGWRGHSGFPEGAQILVSDFYRDWCRTRFSITSSIAVRRDLLLRAPHPFPLGEAMGEDHDLWFRIAEQAPVALCNRPLIDYRIYVAGGATVTHGFPEVLPAYLRLAQRLDRNTLPGAMRTGARALVASHAAGVLRGNALAGNTAKATRQLRAHWKRLSWRQRWYCIRLIAACHLAGMAGPIVQGH